VTNNFDYPEAVEYLRGRVKFDNAVLDTRVGTNDAQYIFNAGDLYRQSHPELSDGGAFAVAWAIYWKLWEEQDVEEV
jgi:hypothetical protein